MKRLGKKSRGATRIKLSKMKLNASNKLRRMLNGSRKRRKSSLRRKDSSRSKTNKRRSVKLRKNKSVFRRSRRGKGRRI